MNLILFLLLIAIACFFQGIVGFGFALIAVPLALLFLDKITVIVSLAVVGLSLGLFLFRKISQPLNLAVFKFLSVAGLIGLPVGIFILKAAPLPLLKVVAGAISVLFTLIIGFSKIKLPQSKFLVCFAGFLSGILQTSISMSGPPVVLLLTGIGSAKDELRKTTVSFFLFLNIVSIPLFLATLPVTWGKISYGIFAIPAAILGGYLGDRVSGKISQNAFKIIVLTFVFLAGILSVCSGLR